MLLLPVGSGVVQQFAKLVLHEVKLASMSPHLFPQIMESVENAKETPPVLMSDVLSAIVHFVKPYPLP